MNTIILFWNPAVSSYTMERMREDMAHWTHVGNWSVWQHEAAKKGDHFIDAVNLDTVYCSPKDQRNYEAFYPLQVKIQNLER